AGLNSLNDEDVLAGLKDRASGVRENAVKLAEPRVASKTLNSQPSTLNTLLNLASDSDARVRFQLAFTLGEILSFEMGSAPASGAAGGAPAASTTGVRREGASNSGRGAHAPQSISERAADARAAIARRDAADPWIRTAVLSSVANTSDQLLTRLLADAKFTASPAAIEMFRQFAQIVGTRGKDDEIQHTLEVARQADALLEVALGVGEGLKRAGHSLRQSAAPRLVDGLLDQGRDTALAEAPLDTRLKAIRVLAYD